MEGERISIRMDFEEEDIDRFKAVKKWMGLKQNTEVIRALISEKYHEKHMQPDRLDNRDLLEAFNAFICEKHLAAEFLEFLKEWKKLPRPRE